MEKTIMHFNNQYQMREYLNNPHSKWYNSRVLESEMACSNSFCPVSWTKALEQFEKGIPENVDGLKKSVEQVRKDFAKTKTMTKLDYVGQKPHVARALMGQPKSMIHRVKTRTPTKTINIVYNMTAGCTVTYDEMIKSGNAIAQLVTALEFSGIKVRLEVSCGGRNRANTEHFYWGYTLKQANQKLDLLRITFPLQSPAMFRRIGFKMIEIIPFKYDITKKCGGYGLILTDEQSFINEYYPTMGLKKDNTFYFDHYKIKTNGYDYKTMLDAMI